MCWSVGVRCVDVGLFNKALRRRTVVYVFKSCIMGKINRFEELRCWQASRKLVKEIYRMSESGKLSRDFDTKSQLRRAALSSMNNIVEGFDKFSNREFIRYLDISQSSALEVKSMLYVLFDMKYEAEEKLAELHLLIDEVRNLTLGFIKYPRTREKTSNTNIKT